MFSIHKASTGPSNTTQYLSLGFQSGSYKFGVFTSLIIDEANPSAHYWVKTST